jgi:23S rRNA pseudouridine2605 synthase
MPRRPTNPSKTRADAGAQGERLQKVIAQAGIASRRAAEKLIVEGRVRVNGRVVAELGTRVDPRRDRVSVDGRRIRGAARPRYYVVHKPRGVVTTTDDPQARRTVLDLVPARERLFPVGRLDAASEGLILMTNDGAVAQAMLHPSFEVPRVYQVSVDGRVDAATMSKLSAGIELETGERTAPCEVRLLARDPARTRLEIRLTEGRRRQIRRMLEQVGHPVRRLLRVQFGPLHLRGLRPGEWRRLRGEEAAALDRMAEQARHRRRS